VTWIKVHPMACIGVAVGALVVELACIAYVAWCDWMEDRGR
jgi:hypothetical protein